MAMNAQQSSGLSAKVRDMWQRNQDLLKNAGSLAATTGLTSLFGFVFWIIAAKGFSKQAVGYGETTTNAMQLLGTIGMFGLGTMLIGELPKRPERERGGLFAASLAASGLGSLVLGLAFPVAARAFHADFPEIEGTLPRLLVFAAGAMLTASTLVFDEGTIGLMRGGVQLWRNLFMSGAKLLALPVTAFVLHDQFGVGISLSFVLGTAVSVVPAVFMLLRGGTRVFHRPDWGLLRRLAKVAINHNWLNLAIAVPPRLIPVLVTAAVGPSNSAVFYIAWMITSFLFMVPVHLGTVLFAIASASPELVAEKLRFVLRTSLLIGLPVMAVLGLGAHFILSLIGPGYAAGTIVLWTLVIGYIPQLPRAQFIAVSRATGKVGRAALLVCIFATCECVAIYIGGRREGLDGMSFAYLGMLIVEGIVYAPTVLRAAYASTATAIATGSFPAVAGATGAQPAATGALGRLTGPLTRLTGSLTELPGTAGRQETGLAALFALAATAASNGHTLDVATEVWRTGSFPALRNSGSFKALRETGSFRALPPDDAPPAKAVRAATMFDLYGGQTAGVPAHQQSYRTRQMAGIDALLALATPEVQRDDASERPG
jgi:O-antigen/teichoic acid export membrane protein